MATRKDSHKKDKCKEYRDKHPEMPTKTLATLMFKENPVLFKDIEDARGRLRYIEGKQGESKRFDDIKASKYFKVEERPKAPYSIPKPDSEDLKPYLLPKLFNRFILAGDFHVPNHRTEPIEAMLDYAEQNGIRKLFINGDLLDNTPFTRWMREPLDKGDVKRWFDMASALLHQFKQSFDEIYWLEGNHDFWYKRYLMEKAPELFGDSYYDLESRLKLNEIGVKFIDQRYLVKAGHLNITHGHILFRGGGSYANAARMLYQKTKANTIASHVHVESSHTEPDLNDKIITTFTTGCMCSLRPDYQPYGGKACHGFADITVHANGDFNVKNLRIFKGKIL
jgi:predicted phosphodiesterase